MSGGLVEVLFPASELRARVRALGAAIERDHEPTRAPLLLVGILKGSTFFLADLVRALRLDVSVDFMSISSYAHSGPQSGIVRILKDLDEDIGGRDVVLVEDIVDTGLTLNYLRRTLAGRAPNSLRTVTLLDKSARRIVPVEIEYTGFQIPDVFVLGYGLDWQGLYRNLPELLVVTDVARLASDPLAIADRFGVTDAERGVRFGP
ncbi:MAG: hypoxanthine phosphoribosyltransferase [Actinomycetota bacterium]